MCAGIQLHGIVPRSFLLAFPAKAQALEQENPDDPDDVKVDLIVWRFVFCWQMFCCLCATFCHSTFEERASCSPACDGLDGIVVGSALLAALRGMPSYFAVGWLHAKDA